MEGNPMRFQRLRRHGPAALAAVIMTSIVVVLSYVLLRVQEPRFGKEKFELLHEGMTEAEVVAVLGCPAGDYRPEIWKHPTWFVSPSDAIGFPEAESGRPLEEMEELKRKDVEKWMNEGQPIPPSPPSVYQKWWWAREYGIDVYFDAHDRVIHCTSSRFSLVCEASLAARCSSARVVLLLRRLTPSHRTASCRGAICGGISPAAMRKVQSIIRVIFCSQKVHFNLRAGKEQFFEVRCKQTCMAELDIHYR